MAVLVIDDFSKGIDRRTFGKPPSADYAWEMFNFDLEQYGRLVKRLGYTRLNTTQMVASTTVDNLFAYFNQNRNRREILALLSNGSLQVRDDAGASLGSFSITFATRRDVQWSVLRSIVCHTLGSEFPRFIYDDTSFGTTPLAAPTFTPTLTAAAGGLLDTTAWYRYRFTYAATTSLGGQTLAVATESIPRSTTKTDTTFDVQLTGANNRVNITSLAASSDSMVNNTRIYRSHGQPTRAALDTVETYFVAQQSDAITTYTDTTADSALGGLLDTYDHDRLGTDVLSSTNRLRAVAIFNDRIWFSKDVENVIICSKRLSQDSYLGSVGDAYPYVFPAENIIAVGQGDGDTITIMDDLRGELLIFKRYSTWILSGATEPTNPPVYQLRKLFGDIGCYAEHSLVNTGNLLIWLSHKGVYSWDGSELKYIGDGIHPIISGSTQTNQMEAWGIWADRENEYWLAINDAEDLTATPGGYTTATRDRIFKYDFYRKYWRSDVIPSTISSLGVLIPNTTAQTPLVLAGSDNESFIYRMLNGTTDAVAGVATEVTARWQSHYLDIATAGRMANDRGGATLGNRLGRKTVRELYVGSVLTSDTDRRPRYTYFLESDNGATSNTVTITPTDRDDILSCKGGTLHIGRDVRLRVSLDTRASEANQTNAATTTFAMEFEEQPLR